MGILAALGIMLALFSTIAAADVQLDVPLYGQRDSAWADDKLEQFNKQITANTLVLAKHTIMAQTAEVRLY